MPKALFSSKPENSLRMLTNNMFSGHFYTIYQSLKPETLMYISLVE